MWHIHNVWYFVSLTAPFEKVSVTTENTDQINSGAANWFPQLKVNKGRYVVNINKTAK